MRAAHLIARNGVLCRSRSLGSLQLALQIRQPRAVLCRSFLQLPNGFALPLLLELQRFHCGYLLLQCRIGVNDTSRYIKMNQTSLIQTHLMYLRSSRDPG